MFTVANTHRKELFSGGWGLLQEGVQRGGTPRRNMEGGTPPEEYGGGVPPPEESGGGFRERN